MSAEVFATPCWRCVEGFCPHHQSIAEVRVPMSVEMLNDLSEVCAERNIHPADLIRRALIQELAR